MTLESLVTFVHLEKVRTPLLLLFPKWGKQIEKSLAEQLRRKTQAAHKQLNRGSYTPQPHPMTTTEAVQTQTLLGNSPSLRREGARQLWDPVCTLLQTPATCLLQHHLAV